VIGLRFFADHFMSNAIMQTLREAGHEVVRLREQLPVESPDAVVAGVAFVTFIACELLAAEPLVLLLRRP
jgi:hypothetical protein